MRKLVESTFVTLDGEIGSPQVWGPPYLNDEHSTNANRLLFESDALLLGRLTWEAVNGSSRESSRPFTCSSWKRRSSRMASWSFTYRPE